MHRRDLLKFSALSVAGLGLKKLGANPSPETVGKDSALTSSVGPDSPLLSRERPKPLDLAWANGTGLIWMADETLFYDNPRNRFMRFRRSFEVTGEVARAELRLFADTNYIAWINGVEVGRGPGRSDPTWTFFDTYDVARLLKPGTNTIAVLAVFHGFGTGGRQSIMQAMLAHLEIQDASGRKTAIVSDKSWKASPAAEFLRPSPRLHATLGCMEIQDRRLAEEGWEQPGYDDSKWKSSDYVKPDLSSTPWYHFAPEPLPARTLDIRPFAPGSLVSEIDFAPPSVETLGAVRPPLPAGAKQPLPLRVQCATSHQAKVVTLDIGRTECGYFELEAEGPAGAVIDVLCGEMLIDGRVPKPGTARVHTTRFVLREGRQTLRFTFNWIAFRYAQLWIWTPGPLTIYRAALQHLSLPLGASGHFSCNDDFLNRLDQVCEHTLRLCTQDGIVDSASREQQQWIGDGRFTVLHLHHRFAAGVIHRRLIDQIGQGIDWMGSLVPRYPTGNLNVSPIPLYSLHWILAFRDYAWFTGDEKLAHSWWPSILHVLRWFTAFERSDGLLERVPHWMYIELGEGPRPGRVPTTGVINATLNLHYQAALTAAGRWGSEFGDEGNSRHFSEKADRLAASIRERFWDGTVGAYRDSLGANGEFGSLSEGTNGHALVHLEKPESARALQIITAIFADPKADPIRASPFAMNAVLEALSLHGRGDLAIPRIKERYAPQLETGSTWEHWRSHHFGRDGTPEVHSLSHAWGAAPLSFFINTLAGIRPASPGWRTVVIAPQPGSLRQAAGSVETAVGRIESRWGINGTQFELRATLPPGVTGTYRLPDGATGPLPSGETRVACRWTKA